MLVPGTLLKVRTESYQDTLFLKLTGLEAVGARYKCSASDGSDTVKAMLASQLCELVTSGKLTEGAIVRLPGTGYSGNLLANQTYILMLSEMEVVQPGADSAAIKEEDNSEAPVNAETPDPKKAKLNSGHATGAGRVLSNLSNGQSAASTQPRSNAGSMTPGPAPSPSEEVRVKAAPKTPLGAQPPKSPPQPPSQQKTPTASSRTSFHPIAGLHPYTDTWCIRAVVSSKGNLRTINTKRGEQHLMSVDLVDDSGSAIQGTFWGAQAQAQHSTLEEGKVYVISRFQVKPANKQYSSVKNDYEIAFTDRTEVVEAADQDHSAMAALLDLVTIDALPKYIARRTPVDLLGVVLSVAALGTVKRKSDSTELQRRDVTLTDKSLKSVVLTLWGDNAANPALDNTVPGNTLLQVAACRVTDYNGCSVSTLQKSHVTLNPTGKAADELRSWYDAHGADAVVVPLSSDTRPAGAAGGRDKLDFLKDLPASASSDPAVKPEYHNMIVTVAQIREDQNHSYLANPENGRKVVEQDGKLWCEADGKFVPVAEQRYIMSFKAIDSTGIAYLNTFNKEGEVLMGQKADTLAVLKASGSDKFSTALANASWREWAVTTSSRGREYQGEVKVRHTLFDIRPINFVTDGMKLVGLINRYV